MSEIEAKIEAYHHVMVQQSTDLDLWDRQARQIPWIESPGPFQPSAALSGRTVQSFRPTAADDDANPIEA